MLMRQKIRRRLIIAASIALFAALSLGATYLWLNHRRDVKARDAYQTGLRQMETGEFETALQNVGRYVQRNPEDMSALATYASLRQKVTLPNNRHLSDAMKIYARVVNADLMAGDARQELMKLYQAMGFDTELLSLADRILARDANDLKALYFRAVAMHRLSGTGKKEPALAAILLYVDKAPQDIAGYLLALDVMRQLDRPDERIAQWVDSLQKSQGETDRVAFLRSVAAAIRGDLPAAQALARQAVAKVSNDAETVRVFSAHCDRLGLYEESVRLLETYAKAVPSEAGTQLLVTRLFIKGDHAKILEVTSSADAGTVALFYRALSASELGKDDTVTKSLESIRSGYGKGTNEIWHGLADSLLNRASDPTALLRNAQAVLAIEPSNSVARLATADATRALGEVESAFRVYRQIASVEPRWSRPLTRLAELAISSGRSTDGERLAEAALTRNPQDAEAKLRLAQAKSMNLSLADSQELQSVIKLLDEVASSGKTQLDQQCVLVRVSALIATGDRVQAENVIDQAINSKKSRDRTAWIKLLVVSEPLGLNVQERISTYYEQSFGNTPELAGYYAQRLLDAGDTSGAMSVIMKGLASSKPEDQMEWRILEAIFLEQTQDPKALATWTALAEKFPDSLKVQWLALASKSAKSDHAFEGQLLERIGQQEEMKGNNWRLAKAQWLMKDNTTQRNSEAVLMLNGMVKNQPDWITARLLLADCMVRLNQETGAVAQLAAASDIDPQSATVALKTADLMIKRGENRNAMTYLRRAVDSAAASESQRITAAASIAALGDPVQALEALDRIYSTQLNDGSASADLTLIVARLCAATNQPARVEQLSASLIRFGTSESLAFLASFYASIGRAADADAVLAKLGQSNGEPGQIALLAAQHQLRFGKPAEALSILSDAVAKHPQDVTLWRQLIRATAGFEGFDKAAVRATEAAQQFPQEKIFQSFVEVIPMVTEIAPKWPEAVEIAVDMIDRPADTNVSKQAIQELQSFARAGGTGKSAASDLGRIAAQYNQVPALQKAAIRAYLDAGLVNEAATLATRSAGRFPTDRKFPEFATIAYSLSGNWREAAALASEWRKRNASDSFTPDMYFASATAKLGDIDQATKVIRPYIDTQSTDESQREAAAILLSTIQIANGNVQDAELLLAEKLSISPKYRIGWASLAGTSIGDLTTARGWLQRVEPLMAIDSLEEQGMLIDAWMSLRNRGGDSSDTRLARNLAEQLLKKHEKNVALATSVAQLREADGDRSGAEALYRSILTDNPNEPLACNNLAMILLLSNRDLEQAEKYALIATQQEKHPARVDFLDTLADIQFARGERKIAVDTLKKASEINPQRSDIQLKRLEWLITLGERDTAKRELDQFDASGSQKTTLNASQLQKLSELRSTLLQ